MSHKEFITTIALRWSDQDINGHVNNAKIVTVIEEARIYWLNKFAAREGITTFIAPKVVASLEVEYHSSVTAEANLITYVSAEHIGRTSFTLRYRGEQNDQDVFTARTVLVMLDKDSLLPRALNEREREYLNRYALTPLDPDNLTS